ncbi:MAG: hypothetical protein RLZZ344_803 [Pseudomonadota bacterium]|jgi:hypothetical protein
MPIPAALRVQKRRELLRAAGLRPVQLWVPDTRGENFATRCRQESLLVAKADKADTGLARTIDFLSADLLDHAD